MIYLVRHGQTQANASGRLQGRADLPLTELGREQAAAVAAVLPSEATIHSSPLTRARQTAEILARGREVRVDDRWIEVDYGDYDGMAVGSVPAEEWAKWRSDPHFRPPGGESLAQCGARVRAACADLSAAGQTGDVVVVSHVSPIKAAVVWALGVGDEASWHMYLGLASICRVSITARGSSLYSFNESSHLEASSPVSNPDPRR